jgi:hypothetical protein
VARLLLPGPQVVQAAQLEQQASQPPAARPRVAQQVWVSGERKPEPGVQKARARQALLPEPRLLASAERLAERDAPAQAQRKLPSSA